MNVFYYLIVLTIICECVWAQGPTDRTHQNEFDRKVSELLGNPAGEKSWITPEILPSVVERLKWMRAQLSAAGSNFKREEFYIDQTLLALDDHDTIERLINDYHEDKGEAETLLESGQGTVLSYLVKDLSTGSTLLRHGFTRLSIRDNSAVMMLRVIWRNESFPELTRKWAKGLAQHYDELDRGNSSLSNLIRNVQQWWDHNHEAVESKQYEEATWIPPDYARDRYENETLKYKVNKQAEQKALLARFEKDNATRAVGQPPAAPRGMEKSKTNMLAYAAAFFVAIITGSIVFIHRKKHIR